MKPRVLQGKLRNDSGTKPLRRSWRKWELTNLVICNLKISWYLEKCYLISLHGCFGK